MGDSQHQNNDTILCVPFPAQTDVREHFGIAAPTVEHRAWQDVEVLSEVVGHLLSACKAPSLQHFMDDTAKHMGNGTPVTHSGLVSELLSSRLAGVSNLRYCFLVACRSCLQGLDIYACDLQPFTSDTGRLHDIMY